MGRKSPTMLRRVSALADILSDGEDALGRVVDVADTVRDGATKGREAIATIRNGLARALGGKGDRQPPIRVHADGVEVKPRRR